MRVIVGLGNPGARYRGTRHNAGFELVDGIADGTFIDDADIEIQSRNVRHRAGRTELFRQSSGPYLKLGGTLHGTRFLLVKPTTFMNESGRAVAHILRKGVARGPEELLVVVDDVNLDLGRVRIRAKGTSGGQKGLANIIERIGTEEFARLRIGVGPRPDGDELTKYVLGRLSPSERDVFDPSLCAAADGVAGWIEEGVDRARQAMA